MKRGSNIVRNLEGREREGEKGKRERDTQTWRGEREGNSEKVGGKRER